MDTSRALVLAVALVATSLTGCIGGQESVDPASTPATSAPNVSSYVPVETSNLSEPVFDVGPRITERVSASVGNVDLFVEYWLPESQGDGPFPTVLHSTPYSHLDRSLYATSPATGIESPKEFWVSRGYAYVVADVRGFGESEGCVEVWGPGEQADQAELVNWVADQDFSDGSVGMVGASYPGTTPMEAAVQAPEALDAIIPVAGLTDPYYDWHFGGVPNGESGPVGSPAAYQGIGSVLPHSVTHGADWAESTADTACETASLVMEAYRSDGTYSEFYEDRNLSARADNVEAAMLYSQGFDDGNVKPSQVLNWFNEVDAEKKGLFGHWGHQYPPREDWNDLKLAWFDEHLKGHDTGVMDGPTVEVLTNLDTWRADEAFPSNRTSTTPVYLDAPDRLSLEPASEGEVTLATDRAKASAESYTAPVTGTERIVLETEPLDEDLYISGVQELAMRLTLDGAENAFLQAELYRVDGDEATEITYGMQNLALRNGVHEYEPMPEGEETRADMRFQPVESIVEAGTSLRLVIEPVSMGESDTHEALAPGSTLTLHTGGEDGTRLELSTLDGRPDQPRPDDV